MTIGSFAIGGPTLEMFIESYNAKHDEKISTYSIPINASENGINGYKVKLANGTSWGNSVSNLDTTDSETIGEGNMWIRTDNTKAQDYWLASPSNENMRFLYTAGYNKIVSSMGGRLAGTKICTRWVWFQASCCDSEI